MIIKIIPTGTRIYLTKKKPFKLYIKPDKTLLDDNLYVAYDVKLDGCVAIPKGTRVTGNWITESSPSIAAQLQLTRIFLDGYGQQICADSDVIEAISDYNGSEVCHVNSLYKQNQYRSPANVVRRIVDLGCSVKTLLDNNLDTIYLEIFTKEIPVTLTKDFTAFPNVA